MNQLISDVKRALDEIKRLRGRVDTFSTGSTLMIPNGVSGVLLSNANPTIINDDDVPVPGVSTEAARSDHGHGENLTGTPLSDNIPEPVGDIGAAGTSPEGSRSDHVHVGAAGQYRQFVYDNSNPFQFVVDGAGQPIFALEDLE